MEAGSRIEDIEAARARVGLADANVALADALLDKTFIRSPVTGSVLRRYRAAGEAVLHHAVVAGEVDLPVRPERRGDGNVDAFDVHGFQATSADDAQPSAMRATPTAAAATPVACNRRSRSLLKMTEKITAAVANWDAATDTMPAELCR